MQLRHVVVIQQVRLRYVLQLELTTAQAEVVLQQPHLQAHDRRPIRVVPARPQVAPIRVEAVQVAVGREVQVAAQVEAEDKRMH